MKIYLDVCCLCRPFDDPHNPRIHLEAEAIIAILQRCLLDWELVGSDAVEYEIRQISDPERLSDVRKITAISRLSIAWDQQVYARAGILTKRGIDPMDAIHIASAEQIADVFLTTDSSLIKTINTRRIHTDITIANPVDWYAEVTRDENQNAP